MRRRAAFYLLLGLVMALLIVTLATGLQTGGSTDPNAWMWAQRHTPLLQMLDMASAVLFVVIGIYGLTVCRLELQLRHQAEDFGDQMETLLHRNEELVQVNEEYAEQIAALETDREESPAITLGDRSQRVLAALHRQVDAQAQQLETVHVALEQQNTALHELRQHVHHLEEDSAPRLAGGATAPTLVEARPPDPIPEDDAQQERALGGESTATADWTVNDHSTLIGGMLEFDVGASDAQEAPLQSRPQAVPWPEGGTYPVDDSMLAVAAGHLSSMPDAFPAPPPEPPRVEISVGIAPEARLSEEPPAALHDLPPTRTQGALALDLAESALSSLKSETQEALSSLRAQVEASIPQEAAPAPTGESARAVSPPARRKRWHLRF
jgi:hypothetical protein